MRWALVLALVGCSGGGRALRHPERMSIWAESLPLEQIEARLTFASENRLDVNVSVVKGTVDRAYLQALCQSAEKHDVAIRLWPGLSHDSGYWPSQVNVDEFLPFVDELAGLAGEVCPRLDGFVIDMEMPIYKVDQLRAMREAGASNIDIANWLLGGIDAAKFERARGLYQAAAARMHGLGYSFSVTTLPMNADDYGDGDETIAKALWTPIEGIDWDVVSFQIYRSLYDQQFPDASGKPYTPGLVTSYAHSVVGRWGARGAVDLGTTGGGIGITHGLASAADLQGDIAAARAEGITPGHVAIYSLEGLDGKPDAVAWVTVPAARAAPITDPDDRARSIFGSLDLLGN
jgi:hypothetical protein